MAKKTDPAVERTRDPPRCLNTNPNTHRNGPRISAVAKQCRCRGVNRLANGSTKPRATPATGRASPRPSVQRLNASRRRTNGYGKTSRSCKRQQLLRGGTRPPKPLIMGIHAVTTRVRGSLESLCRVFKEQGVKIAARPSRFLETRPCRYADGERRAGDGCGA